MADAVYAMSTMTTRLTVGLFHDDCPDFINAEVTHGGSPAEFLVDFGNTMFEGYGSGPATVLKVTLSPGSLISFVVKHTKFTEFKIDSGLAELTKKTSKTKTFLVDGDHGNQEINMVGVTDSGKAAGLFIEVNFE